MKGGAAIAPALMALASAASGQAVPPRAASAATAPQGPPPVVAQRHHYVCDGGERVQTDVYLTEAGPSFIVLHYKGHRYGLAQAVSASGARYVGLVGTNPEVGLEWWGKGNTAMLAEVNRQDIDDSRRLLDCKAAPPP
ncbi:MAG: MliC family protein [Proteobacteria bacterium]|nr:MliC family protein [Pseudomonadota bacterium]